MRAGEFVTNKQVMECVKGQTEKFKVEILEEIKNISNVALVEECETFLIEDSKNDFMIMDSGAPHCLVGHSWLKTYLEENSLKKEDLEKEDCVKKFRFCPGRVYISKVR